jgi:hypothetical protein
VPVTLVPATLVHATDVDWLELAESSARRLDRSRGDEREMC